MEQIINSFNISEFNLTENIYIDKYNRVRGEYNHGRIVVFDSSKNCFVKIFNKDYIRRVNFELAIEKNFYDNLAPALNGLIYDGDLLVGYTTEKGTPLSNSEFDINLIPESLWEELFHQINTTGLFYYDMVPTNIIKLDSGEYSLIDLESVYKVDDMDLMLQHDAKIKPQRLYDHLQIKKNIVFIPNIDLGNNRNESYQYSIKSWKHWCVKNNCELIVWEDLIYPIEYMPITWQRYYVMDILDANNINYDQILMADADIIIHRECPNFFALTGHKYCGVMNDGDYEWVLRSIQNFGDTLFDGKRISPWNYINGGFQIVNESHKSFFDHMKLYYKENKDLIESTIKKIKAGTDQTILNFKLQEQDVDVKILPQCFNLQDLTRKNLLYISENCWWPDTLDNLYQSAWIYHLNAIPQNPMNRDTNYWLQRIYRDLYE